MQWTKALESYSFYLQLEQGKSKNTIDGYQFDVRRLVRYCETLNKKNLPLTINTETIKEFVYLYPKRYSHPHNPELYLG